MFEAGHEVQGVVVAGPAELAAGRLSFDLVVATTLTSSALTGLMLPPTLNKSSDWAAWGKVTWAMPVLVVTARSTSIGLVPGSSSTL